MTSRCDDKKMTLTSSATATMRPSISLILPMSSVQLLLLLLSSSHAFQTQNVGRNGVRLFATVKISTPTPDNAAGMGIRDWPQQKKAKGGWSESVGDGETLVRYVLDGTGSVSIVDDNNDKQSSAVGSGSLIEVTGIATLDWTANDDMIILTPGYEEAGLFVGAAVLLLLVTVGGIVLSSN